MNRHLKITMILFISKCVDRMYHSLSHFWIHSRSFIIQKCLSNVEISHLSEKIFNKDLRYLPGGLFYEQGLFSWEVDALKEILSRAQHIVLLGCGAGREIASTRKLNEHVRIEAIDANVSFIESARVHFSKDSSVHLFCKSIESFVKESVEPDLSCDLLWFGWGAFSHVSSMQDAAWCMKSLSQRYPNAPIFLSFFESSADFKEGRHFFPSAGLVYIYNKEVLQNFFKGLGYRATLFKSQPYPHAFFVKGT